VGKFEAVAEGSTGCENRIPQAQRANFYAEVNGASGTHFAKENNTKPLPPVAESLASSSICREIKTGEIETTQGCFGGAARAGLGATGRAEEFFRASARTRPSRGARVIPQRVARVGAISAGVMDWKYSPG